MKTKRMIQRTNETKRFFEKINMFNKPLPKLPKRKREKTQINKN
jgi:hypothetical protein